MEEISIPSEVLFVWASRAGFVPMGLTNYENIIRDYPEWFAEEYNRLIKAEAIPDEVWKTYSADLRAELKDLDSELFKDINRGKGILYYAAHREEFDEYNRILKIREEQRTLQYSERLKIYRRVHMRHLYEYGLSFNKNVVY